MDAGIVPNNNNRAPKVLYQMAKEMVALSLLEVFFVQGIIQTEAVAFGTDRNS